MKEDYKERIKNYLKNTYGNLALEYCEDYSSSSYTFHEAIELSKSKNNFDKILSIIIFHQSTIELMKEMIIHCNFLQQLALYPNEINYKKFNEKSNYIEIKNELNSKIAFERKEKLVSKINELNELRTKYAHKICFEYSIYDGFEKVKLEDLFEEIFKLYQVGLRDIGKKIELLKAEKKFSNLIDDK